MGIETESAETSPESRGGPSNFIRDIIIEDMTSGKYEGRSEDTLH